MHKPSPNKIESVHKVFLKEIINSISPLSPENMQKILSVFQIVAFDKNEKIIKKNEISNNVYFIAKGIIRAYYHKSDREIIDWFGKEGLFFGNIYNENDTKESPGFDTYDAVGNVILLKADYQTLERLLKESPEIENLVHQVKLKNYINYVERVHDLKGLSSEEKYNLFVKKYPDIANRIPLKYLANYLGITAETVSRIRANTLNKY